MIIIKKYECDLNIDPACKYWDNNCCCVYHENLWNDERQVLWQDQRETYGFDEREMWGLYKIIAYFIYPRLKMFIDGGYSGKCKPPRLSQERWDEVLNTILFAFECAMFDFKFIQYKATSPLLNDSKRKKYIKDGLNLFSKYFLYLQC